MLLSCRQHVFVTGLVPVCVLYVCISYFSVLNLLFAESAALKKSLCSSLSDLKNQEVFILVGVTLIPLIA